LKLLIYAQAFTLITVIAMQSTPHFLRCRIFGIEKNPQDIFFKEENAACHALLRQPQLRTMSIVYKVSTGSGTPPCYTGGGAGPLSGAEQSG
jgi:hypothetical protein